MISWIKLDINILDDAKIKIIRSHPNGDSVVLLWIGLLCLAMKSSRPGTIEIADGLPYTLDDLANQFNIEKKTVEMGIALFVKYRMIEVFQGGAIDVINFSKHQKLEGIERTRELTRARTAKYRERLRIGDENVTRHAPVTIRHVTPTDIDKDKDIDVDKDTTCEAQEIIISIPLSNKSDFSVTRAMVTEWESLYPNVDVGQELRNIRGWNISNEKKRKTPRGIMAHINTWLHKAQNRGGNGNGSGNSAGPGSAHKKTSGAQSDGQPYPADREY